MGGLAGHMSHLYDNPELKFREVEDVLTKASNGELVGTEKTDGQNIFISYSMEQRKAVAARNLGNVRSGGMDAAGLAAKFAGRGDLERSFTESFAAFERAVDLFSDKTKYEIFGKDANVWFNAEVQDPRTSNVINYNDKSLTIHRVGHAEFDKKTARPIDGKDVTANAERLENALRDANALLPGEDYSVQVNAVRTLRGLSDDTALKAAIKRLKRIMSREGLGEENTVADFLVKRITDVVEKTAGELSGEVKREITKRILKVPGVTLSTIYKLLDDPSQKDRVRKIVKGDKKIISAAIFPLEDIIHDFSVEMLRGLESAFVIDNEAEVERLKAEVAQAIEAIKGADNDSATEILIKQMKKLKDIENVSTAAEGFVFDYDGNTYKFTGNFAPINQLLGLFRYGRGDVPAMKIDEDGSEVHADIVYVPGSFKPPHVGHFELMKEYLKNADKVVILISDPQSIQSIRFIDMPSMDGMLEVSPSSAKRIFDLYIENAGLTGRIEVPAIWKEGNTNPMQYLHDKLDSMGRSGKEITVALGVSTKDKGDADRFNKNYVEPFEEYKNLTVIPMPKEPHGDFSATKMRNAVTYHDETKDASMFQEFIPDGVSAEAVLNILSSGDVYTENSIEEMSTMGGGAVEGAGRINHEETLIREEEDEMSEFMIDRKTFLEELAIRETIREKLQRKHNDFMTEEQLLRAAIRGMIKEDVSDTPYKSTGINELETLLKKIVPVIEPDYKSLTTSEDQRDSFRAHILKAVQNALAPGGAVTRDSRDIKPLDLPDEDTFDIGDVEEDIEIVMGEPEKFIDIDGDTTEDPASEEGEDFKIDGQEETGRNFAMMTWERIETNIVDSYRKLGAEADRDLFYDYLMANLKLYFDKFDDELAAVVNEPESEIYNDEKGV